MSANPLLRSRTNQRWFHLNHDERNKLLEITSTPSTQHQLSNQPHSKLDRPKLGKFNYSPAYFISPNQRNFLGFVEATLSVYKSAFEFPYTQILVHERIPQPLHISRRTGPSLAQSILNHAKLMRSEYREKPVNLFPQTASKMGFDRPGPSS